MSRLSAAEKIWLQVQGGDPAAEQPTGPRLVPDTAERLRDDRRQWPAGSHEQRVERFYTHGVARYGNYHGGFLNFGLWEDGIGSYEEAARNMVARLVHWGGIGPDSSLLDVACGMGAQGEAIWRLCRPRELVGLDLTWEHIESARRWARDCGLPPTVRFAQGTATQLPFPDARFSHVSCIEGGVHFDTRERFLREAFRVLRPGGVLVLADFTLRAEPGTRLERALLQAVRGGWCIPAENCDTVDEYRDKLRRAGFQGVELRLVGEQTYPRYYREQSRPGHLLRMRAIRGTLPTLGGLLIDWMAYRAWKHGTLEYVLVRAEKPGSGQASTGER